MGGLLWIRHEAQDDGHAYLKVWSIVLPMILCISGAACFFSGPVKERLQRGEDISSLSRLAIITRRWWKIIALAVLSGIVNYWYWYVWKYFFLWKNYGR